MSTPSSGAVRFRGRKPLVSVQEKPQKRKGKRKNAEAPAEERGWKRLLPAPGVFVSGNLGGNGGKIATSWGRGGTKKERARKKDRKDWMEQKIKKARAPEKKKGLSKGNRRHVRASGGKDLLRDVRVKRVRIITSREKNCKTTARL